MNEEIAVSGNDDEKSRSLRKAARLVYFMLVFPVISSFLMPIIASIATFVLPDRGNMFADMAVIVLINGVPIIGVIISSIKRKEAQGTWLESHFRWQIRTFWYTVLFFYVIWTVMVLAVLPRPYTISVMLGGFIYFFWVTYRVIKGGFNLHRNKPMAFWIS